MLLDLTHLVAQLRQDSAEKRATHERLTTILEKLQGSMEKLNGFVDSVTPPRLSPIENTLVVVEEDSSPEENQIVSASVQSNSIFESKSKIIPLVDDEYVPLVDVLGMDFNFDIYSDLVMAKHDVSVYTPTINGYFRIQGVRQNAHEFILQIISFLSVLFIIFLVWRLLRGCQRGQFVCQVIQSVYATYILQIPQGAQNFVPSQPSHRSYPSSTPPHIKTEDGFSISCIQGRPEGNNKVHHPVLCVNGHSTESFWLPTELATQFYRNLATSQSNIAGLILAGSADFKTKFPCLGAIRYYLRQKKKLDFTLQVVGGDISIIPSLADAIEETIKDVVEDSITWLVRKIILILPRELNPVWNAHFEFVVEDPYTQHLVVKIYDDKGLQASEPIGYVPITSCYAPEWEKWWKNPENVELFELMGKDNIPFHTIMFPSTQQGTGEPWTLMKTISGTEYLNYEAGKFKPMSRLYPSNIRFDDNFTSKLNHFGNCCAITTLDSTLKYYVKNLGNVLKRLIMQRKAAEEIRESQGISPFASCAYTGEVTAEMLANLGISWVILGHSERRALLNETNEFVRDTVAYALAQDLKVIAYVGETLRKWLAANLCPEVVESTQIIYGGSIKGANCKQPNVDGFLVGKLLLFSLSRPPEIEDLEDKVSLKGGGML